MNPLQTTWRYSAPAHPLIGAIPAFTDNYFWLIRSADGRSAAVVDPGDAAPVEAALAAAGLELTAIVLTHHHADHVGGVKALRERHRPVVFGPAAESIDGVDHPLAHGDRIELPGIGLALDVIGVPGHTRGHIAYFGRHHGSDARPVLFCGDTLFAGGCGRVFEGTPEQMLASLGRLASLPADTLVYCAHEYTLSNLRFAAAAEPDSDDVRQRLDEASRMRAQALSTVPSTVGVELATNPFLRTHLPGVQASAEQRLGHAPFDAVQAFAAIREWKNVF